MQTVVVAFCHGKAALIIVFGDLILSGVRPCRLLFYKIFRLVDLGMGGAPIRWGFDKRAHQLATAGGDAASEIKKYILESATKNKTALMKELGIDLDEVDAIAWTRFMGSIATRFEVVIKNN